jgi:sigma-B regulation protein RsbU (phosphoserine phosphatase)
MPPRLVITDSLGRRDVPLDKPVVTLGRRSESDVRVNGAAISRQHAEITGDAGTFQIKDCGSKFGTFVNGQRIAAAHPLAHGDQIRLGDSDETEIVFVAAGVDLTRDRSAMSAATELRHMAGLLEGLRALGSGRVLDDVLTLVLDSAIEVTSAERGFIMLADESGTLDFKLGRARGRVTLSGKTFQVSRKIPEDVFATGTVMIVEDLMDEGVAAMHTGTVALGIRHVLCAPLRLVRYVEKVEERADDKVIGVLYLDSRERGALRSNASRTALDTLSTERAKLDQELKVAAAIQQSLLPQSNCHGTFFSSAGSSVPCRAVGGDFYDYVERPDGRFAFILGDVAGKGAPSALLAAAALGMFSAEAAYHDRSAPLMARLNQGLFRRAIGGRFVTAFYGILSPEGALTYCNAGHNAPVLVSRDGVRRLETGGTVLGLFEDAKFDEETVRLSPGDVIVAFSDGLSEALDEAGEEYTDDRLLASVATHRERPPQELLDGLLGDVRRFCGKALPNDDVTVVVVRYDG